MSLRVDLEGNGSGFQAMLDEASARAKEFGREVSGDLEHESNYSFGRLNRSILGMFVGMGAVEGIKRQFEWFVDAGKEIRDTAEQVSMSTDSWQKWTDAVDQAGLSTTGFMRVLETLRQKKTEALTDPKARGELTRLGFTDADLSGDMDMDSFLKKALGAAKGTDEQRKALYDLVGSYGVKYAAALGELPNAKAEFSQNDLDIAKQVEDEIHQVQKNLIEPEKLGANRALMERGYQKAMGMTVVRWLQAAAGRGWLWNKSASWKDGLQNLQDGLPMNYQRVELKDPDKAAAATAKVRGGNPASDPSKPAADPMDDVLARQQKEMALHDQERQARLLDSQRSLMTISERRASIMKEIPELQKQLAERNAKMKGEDFLTDADRTDLAGVTGKARTYRVNELRQKYQDDTDTLQLRLDKERGEMREKPLEFKTDSMSNVGLYSASQVSFNPLVGAHEKTNQLLTQIVHNTTRPQGNGQPPQLRDPFAP